MTRRAPRPGRPYSVVFAITLGGALTAAVVVLDRLAPPAVATAVLVVGAGAVLVRWGPRPAGWRAVALAVVLALAALDLLDAGWLPVLRLR